MRRPHNDLDPGWAFFWPCAALAATFCIYCGIQMWDWLVGLFA